MELFATHLAALQKITEPDFLVGFRLESLARLQQSSPVNFRQGLNIAVEPKDWDLGALLDGLGQSEVDVNLPEVGGVQVSHFKLWQIKQPETLYQLWQRFQDPFWARESDKEQLWWMQQTFVDEIVYVHIDRRVASDEPIVIKHKVQAAPLRTAFWIEAEAMSQVSVVIEKSGKSQGLIMDDIRVLADDEATLDLSTIQDYALRDTLIVQFRQARIGQNAHVGLTDVVMGGSFVKSSQVTSLGKPGASALNTVLYLGEQEQRFDLFTGSRHLAPNTVSNIYTKGVVNHQAKALSRGMIQIAAAAGGSNGYEKQDALMIGSACEADAIPMLQIDNHDVKCSHGSTIGQLDSDKMYYLQSRGLDATSAQQMVVQGYFEPLLQEVADSRMRTLVHKKVKKVTRP